jgi:hypothetical protein
VRPTLSFSDESPVAAVAGFGGDAVNGLMVA